VTEASGYPSNEAAKWVFIMSHKVSELSSDQRIALEALVGRSLRDDESLVVRPCRVIKPAPQGEARVKAAQAYLANLDMLAGRVKDVPEDEIDSAIEEACDHVRHRPE
jgi:hypothetical protein